MHVKSVVYMVMMSAGAASVLAGELPYGQEQLEECLYYIEPDDYFPNGEPPYVPRRNRDALPEFKTFFERSGWTTNQFVSGLILAVTNNLEAARSGDKRKRRVAGRAVWKLSEINRPAVTNFFRWFNDTDDTSLFKPKTVPAMLYYTNLEPEVLDYMRMLCVRTNVYANVETMVMHDMFETLETMPPELKPAATNRVARYMYFAIHHVTDSQGWQDLELAKFMPAYSNSIQRLSLMQYVSTSATNAWERSNAAAIVQALSAIPTNQLNDISWIVE
jgi:hypothetical protein